MKKLIAMIGAVATAFGLYATDLTKSAVSFESAEPGCSGETFNWQADGMWATDYDDVFKFGAVADETTYAGAYTGTTRRNDEFTYGQSQNDQFLKLSTGTNSLQRLFAAKVEDNETAVDTDPIFIDQLVKFTGYEDTQTVFAAGTKVAVWMSEFVIGEENDVEITQTNLYVAVGSVSGGNVTMKNVKIASPAGEGNEYKLDTWYRLTIRSIGNIYGAGAVPSALSGFAIYINGAAIVISQEDQGLLDNADALIPKAKVLYDKGQLFPSMIAGSTTLKSVGFEGMGGIDDMIVDAVGPDFAQEANFDFAEITGAKVLVVSNMTENTELIADANGLYTAIPGQSIRVYFTAKGPYVLKPDPTYKDFTAEAGTDTIEFSDVEPAAAAACINETTYYETLDEAFAAAVAGDTIAVCSEENEFVYPVVDDEELYFMFPAKVDDETMTTIEIGENGIDWTVIVPEESMDAFIDTFGAADGQTISVVGACSVGGTIPATSAIVVMNDAAVGEASVGGSLVVMGEISAEEDTITLGVNGVVKTTVDTLIDDGAFTNDDDDLNMTGPDTDDLYTYTLKGGVEFTIVAPDHTEITGVEGAEYDETTDTYTAEDGAEVTVTLKADEGYLFENKTDTTTEIFEAADGEITLKTAAPAAAPVKKGGMFFITLQDAIDDSAEGDITLCDNLTITAPVTINKDVVIDLAGKTLAYTPTSAWAIRLGDTAEVTAAITNGTITSGFYGVRANQAALTLDNVTITSAARAVQGTTASDIDLSNCTITMNGDDSVAVLTKGGTLDLVKTTVNSTAKGLDLGGTVATIDADSSVISTGADCAVFVGSEEGVKTTLTVAGTVKNTNETPASAASTNYAISGNGTDQTGADVVIAAGAVVQSDTLTAIFFPCAGTLTVNGGTITGCEFGIYAKSGTVTINDGEITATTETVVPVSVDNDGYTGAGYAVCLETGSEQGGYANNLTAAIYGGTFTSVGAAVYNFVRTGADPIAPCITAGAFKAMPDVSLIVTTAGQTAKWVLNEETGYYEPSIATMVCQVGKTQYATLAEAIAAVPADGTATTITMIAIASNEYDTAVCNDIVAGKSITLDLNGKKISATGSRKGNSFIKVENGAEFTIMDSAEGGELYYYASNGDAGYGAGTYAVQNEGTFNLLSGKIIADANVGSATYTVCNQVSTAGKSPVFNMEGGELYLVKGDQTVYVVYNNATDLTKNIVNISGGTITGAEGTSKGIFFGLNGGTPSIEINISGSAVIEGVLDILRANDDCSINITGGGLDISKLRIRNTCTNTKPFITFWGGTIDLAATDITCANTPIAIKGGTFDETGYGLVQGMLASENYAWRDNEDTTYTAYAQYVCQIAGDTPAKYGTLAAAIAEAQSGDTIEFIEDVMLIGTTTPGAYATIPANKELTIDWAGKTLTFDGCKGNGNGFIESNGSLTLTNSVGNGGCVVKNPVDTNWMFRDNGTLIFNGGTYTHEGDGNKYDYIVSLYAQQNSHCYMEINAGTFTAGDTAFRPFAAGSDRTGEITMVMNGGTITAPRGMFLQQSAASVQTPIIWEQNGGELNVSMVAFYAMCNTDESDAITININGGTINVAPNADYAHNAMVSPYIPNGGKTAADCVVVNIDGGNINTKDTTLGMIDPTYAAFITTTLTGGVYDRDVKTEYADSIPAVICEVKEDTPAEGYQTVAKVPAALEIVPATGVASVTYTVNGETSVENQTVVYGDVVKITGIKYEEGYEAGEVQVDDEFKMNAEVMTEAISKSESVKIDVDAQLKTFTVTFADVENGTVETSVTNATMGTEVTIIATPAEGYAVDTIAVTNVDTEAEVTVTGDKFTMPAANVKVYATFKETSSEPIPPIDNPTQGDIEKVFATAQDQTLKTKVTPANYSAFREWSRSLDEDAAKSEGMVLTTPDAFLCFALNSSTLPTGEITSEDVEIKAYNKDTGVIEVEIEGVTPGQNVPAGELAKVLSAVGGETLGGMTAEKVNVSGQCVEAGKIQVTVTPKDTTATTFFIKAELVK